MKLLFLILLLFFACAPSSSYVQAQAASTVAVTANASLPLLVEAFRQEGLAALQKAKDEGASEQDARAALVEVEKRWAPVWKTWDELRAAQAAWVNSIENKQDTASAAEQVKRAYCNLINNWPASVAAVPLPTVACSP